MASYNYEDLAGKLYFYYYVQCAVCKGEVPVGDRTRTRAVARLKETGWKKTEQGYVYPDCSQIKGK
jgi:hypothetical protein